LLRPPDANRIAASINPHQPLDRRGGGMTNGIARATNGGFQSTGVPP
jgi:hypothetical protein